MTVNSLRRTALGWMVGLLAGAGLAAMLVTYGLARREAADFLDGQLRQVALNAGPGLADIDAPPAGDQDPEDQLAVTIWKDGTLLRSDRGIDTVRPDRTGYADIVMVGEPWRSYTIGNAAVTVRVAQRDEVREEFARNAALAAMAPLLLLIPLTWIVVGWAMNRMLRRLDGLVRDLAGRGAAAAAPLPTGDVPVEVLPLVAAMNGLIGRLHAAVEAQKQFLADAAHELRTPLAAIQAEADTLSIEDPAALRGRKAIAGSVRRAGALVDQLLRLARLDTPEPVAVDPVDLGPLVLECVGEQVVVAEGKGVDLGAEVAASGVVPGSESELRVLVGNLIDNAVRYTRAGGQVDVRLSREPGRICLEVRDTGGGLPEGAEARIFDRFYRAARPEIEGTGLGLAIARRIAERHGLCLTVENRRDGQRGVLARILFPV